MRTFNVHLRSGRVVQVQAKSYRHEAEQYVFERGEADEDVQFFVDSEVMGIIEAPPRPRLTIRRVGRAP